MKSKDRLEEPKKTGNEKAKKTGTSAAAKAALAILGVGFVAEITLDVGLEREKKKVFVDEKWPDEEWSSDDWAEEDLDN